MGTGGACCATCRGVVTVPSTAKDISNITYNVEFVGLAHHSTFLAPGAHHIYSQVTPEEHVHTIAYQNADNTLVLVAINDHKTDNATIKVLSRVDDFSYSFFYTLPPGVATFVW